MREIKNHHSKIKEEILAVVVMSMKNDHVDTEMNKATLGRMLKNMLSQLPLDG